MSKNNILIVDDDENIAELISLYLNKECCETEIAASGTEALQLFEEYSPDLVLLDVMLPGMDGYQVCTEIRKTSNTPIIMLSAKGEVFDKVLGLKIGADDYIVKPFDSNELVARVGALLRRSAMTESAQKQPQSAAYDVTSADHGGTFVEYDGLVVNISNYTVTFEGHNLEMPPKELEILYFLASRPNQVFTREQLLDKLWGYEYVGDTRTVDVHIKRLREKLNNNHNWSIATVWGIGYKFEWRS